MVAADAVVVVFLAFVGVTVFSVVGAPGGVTIVTTSVVGGF